jgi:ABC-type multidrug transport system ATPase subunit
LGKGGTNLGEQHGQREERVMRRGGTSRKRTDDVLTVRGLTRSFGAHVVLESVSLSLRAGRICAVTGPNGAGKTTLLRCIAGTIKPDAGDVLLLGQPVDETDPASRAAIASVLDDIDFFPDLSVFEHLELMAYTHATPDPVEVVDEIISALALESARDQLPLTLSSGQRRRLALASCFVRPRRLLVLDEPEQRLDAAGREWLADKLRQEKRDGVAVLMASHDADLVDATADQRLAIGD